MSLTRDEFLAIDDITIKEITIPATIPAWGGKSLFIKQLTRGQQDAYLKRQWGDTRMKQDARAKEQNISGMNIYGHDAWLCVRGCCDKDGSPLFADKDIDAMNGKSGEAIGWIAAQIVEFSGMTTDTKIAKGEITPEDALTEEIKNS
jgi:hypothetical protein